MPPCLKRKRKHSNRNLLTPKVTHTHTHTPPGGEREALRSGQSVSVRATRQKNEDVKRGPVCIGSLMRCGFIGSRPLHRFPFSSFPPLHTSVFLFLSCPPVFMSGHLILSFVCAHMGPGLSVYARNLLQPRFQVAQVFIMRRVFIGCPCALGSLSSQPHTPR